MIKKKSRNLARKRRHLAVRKKINGTAEIPRVSVFRSARHIYAQLIDDTAEVTLLQASTMFSETKKRLSAENMKKTEVAKEVGKHLGEMAVQKGITRVRFDRGGYAYHGRIKSLADGIREAGVEF
ncbi:MAG: 50S ribosomal protein L18 [Candidatus Dadabacteria bacterium]|nr:50S ribosomal protein L18 [Candidatus Dadabacteria bacterium]MDE0159133.1 50S ribosomal protein L18 [Candidatus Dadabacteria bacterium]MDE0291275.1 50S ribosomal protein L18 [Candidatus Dadabacteria bacterium]MDE0476647.1 50S ribosomal protein L18 [Candidatus Dadabacteria bacterium]